MLRGVPMFITFIHTGRPGHQSGPLVGQMINQSIRSTNRVRCQPKTDSYVHEKACQNINGFFADFMMVKWSCCSALCFNIHITADTSGNRLKFYRLPRSTELQRECSNILQTTGINRKSAYICSQHWSKGFREIVKGLPDVPAHESQIARLRINLKKA